MMGHHLPTAASEMWQIGRNRFTCCLETLSVREISQIFSWTALHHTASELVSTVQGIAPALCTAHQFLVVVYQQCSRTSRGLSAAITRVLIIHGAIQLVHEMQHSTFNPGPDPRWSVAITYRAAYCHHHR